MSTFPRIADGESLFFVISPEPSPLATRVGPALAHGQGQPVGSFRATPQVRGTLRLVDRILAAKQRDPSADTTAQEREIDQIVYRLFDLTPAEIAQIEGTLASTRRAGGKADYEDSGE